MGGGCGIGAQWCMAPGAYFFAWACANRILDGRSPGSSSNINTIRTSLPQSSPASIQRTWQVASSTTVTGIAHSSRAKHRRCDHAIPHHVWHHMSSDNVTMPLSVLVDFRRSSSQRSGWSNLLSEVAAKRSCIHRSNHLGGRRGMWRSHRPCWRGSRPVACGIASLPGDAAESKHMHTIPHPVIASEASFNR